MCIRQTILYYGILICLLQIQSNSEILEKYFIMHEAITNWRSEKYHQLFSGENRFDNGISLSNVRCIEKKAQNEDEI